VLGTYSHGIFDDDAFRHSFVNAVRAACGLAPASSLAFVAAEREARLDRLAAHVQAALDVGLIRSWIE
jgi:adenosylcobyric acid synthase